MVVQAGVGVDAALLVKLSSGGSTSSTTATGRFRPSSPLAPEAGLMSVAVGDFNGDGKSDLVTADVQQQRRAFSSATATGRFRLSSPSAPETSSCQSLWPTSTATARVTW